MKKTRLILALLFGFASCFSFAENIVTTGQIKHNGLDANGNLETIHQDVIWGGALSADWYYIIGENFVPNISYVHKYGFNPSIENSVTFETIWSGGGNYTGFNATEAQTIEVASSDITDVGALVSSGTVTEASNRELIDSEATFITDGVVVGDIVLNDSDKSHATVSEVTSETRIALFSFNKTGAFLSESEVGDNYRIATATSTGAAVVELLRLLDGDLDNETSEFIILNGTSWVDTVGTYKRASRGGIIIAGSGGENAGVITARQKTTPANVFLAIPAGYNHSMVAAFTIPSGQEGHVLSWYVALAGKVTAVCVARMIVRHPGEVFAVKELLSVTTGGTLRNYQVPKNDLPPGTDLAIEASCDTNSTGVSAGFDLIVGTHN